MERQYWDVKEFINKRAFLRLVDNSSGSWGFLNFDDFNGDVEICGGKLLVLLYR